MVVALRLLLFKFAAERRTTGILDVIIWLAMLLAYGLLASQPFVCPALIAEAHHRNQSRKPVLLIGLNVSRYSEALC
jgi:hypothetical protein